MATRRRPRAFSFFPGAVATIVEADSGSVAPFALTVRPSGGVSSGMDRVTTSGMIGGVVGGHIGLQLHWLDTYEPASVSGGGMSNVMKPGHPMEFRNITSHDFKFGVRWLLDAPMEKQPMMMPPMMRRG